MDESCWEPAQLPPEYSSLNTAYDVRICFCLESMFNPTGSDEFISKNIQYHAIPSENGGTPELDNTGLITTLNMHKLHFEGFN